MVRIFYAAKDKVVLPFKIVDKILNKFTQCMYFDHSNEKQYSPVVLIFVLHKVVLTLTFLSGKLKPPFNESY